VELEEALIGISVWQLLQVITYESIDEEEMGGEFSTNEGE
jgi:hypothetical protein